MQSILIKITFYQSKKEVKFAVMYMSTANKTYWPFKTLIIYIPSIGHDKKMLHSITERFRNCSNNKYNAKRQKEKRKQMNKKKSIFIVENIARWWFGFAISPGNRYTMLNEPARINSCILQVVNFDSHLQIECWNFYIFLF